MIGVIERPFTWAHWSETRELLSRSVERCDDTSIEDVERELRGNAALWVNLVGSVRYAAVGQLIETKNGLQFYIWQAAGEFEPFGRDMMTEAERWARSIGCTSMEMNGRVGWQRKFPDWKVEAITLRKVL